MTAPREIPMLFQTPMITALLEGRKTQTRRLKFDGKLGDLIWCREAWRTYPSLNDVRAADVWAPDQDRGDGIYYEAGGGMSITKDFSASPRRWIQHDEPAPADWGRLRASMHLPKWGSRLTLVVTDVRREPLQDISEADAMAEGLIWDNVIIGSHGSTGRHVEVTANRYWNGTEDDDFEGHEHAVDAYAELWDSINGEKGFGWDANPEVVAVSFDVVRENIIARAQPAPAGSDD